MPQTSPIFLTSNEDPETDVPHFSLAAFIGDDGDRSAVNILVGEAFRPDVKKHASAALLYGLAILTLDAQGVIAAEVDRLMDAGPISEVDAINRISLLLKDSQNVEPV